MTIHITDKILAYLKTHVSAARYKHTAGTWRVALTLANKHNVPEQKTTLAALLHDAGKSMPGSEMAHYAAKHKISFPEQTAVLRFNPSLLHAYISADIARRVFGIDDADVLDAIRTHTLGAPGMSTLAKVIYLADATSPDRRWPGVQDLRRVMHRDLDKAMLMAIAEKTAYVLTQRKWLHPQAAAAWNYFVDTVE